jgi:hypothetical protein
MCARLVNGLNYLGGYQTQRQRGLSAWPATKHGIERHAQMNLLVEVGTDLQVSAFFKTENNKAGNRRWGKDGPALLKSVHCNQICRWEGDSILNIK